MLLAYLGFLAVVVGLLALDLGVFHRRPGADSVRSALGWSAGWISLGLAFTGVVYLAYQHHWLGLGTGADATTTAHTLGGTTIYNDGASAAVRYLTGFVVEKALAIDNIFVVAMIFGSLKVPAIHQHRVLFWGIAGALLMRGAMIAAGAALLARFGWVMYLFGGFLVVTGLRMLFARGHGGDLADSRPVRLLRRLIPTTDRLHGGRFFVRERGLRRATPLLLALVTVELADVVFAVDSIPAVFAITSDPFLVFTSNVFAILGLRSLYFALAGMIDRFHHLPAALAVVLVMVGGKMLAHGWLRDLLGPAYTLYVLAAIVAVIAAGVVASLLRPRPYSSDSVASTNPAGGISAPRT